MKSLHAHIEDGNFRTEDIAHGMIDWLDERLLMPDAFAALGALLPEATDADLLDVVATVCQIVRQP